MLTTPYCFLILLILFDGSTGVHSASIDGHIINISRVSNGRTRRIMAGERAIKKGTTIPMATLGPFAAFATEITGTNNEGKRKNRNITSSIVAAAGGPRAFIRDDGTALTRGSDSLPSTFDASSTARRTKHRPRRRCRNRLGCLRFVDDLETAELPSNDDDREPNAFLNVHSESQNQPRRGRYSKRLLREESSLALFRREFVVPAAGVGPFRVLDTGSREIDDTLGASQSRRARLVSENLAKKVSSKRARKGNDKSFVSTSFGERVATTARRCRKHESANGETEVNETPSSRDKRNDLDVSQLPGYDDSEASNRVEGYRNSRYEFDAREEKIDAVSSRKTGDHREGNDSPGGDAGTSIYRTIDDNVVHERLAALLARLFDGLENSTVMAKRRALLVDLETTTNRLDNEKNGDDPCQKWMDSKEKLEEAFLGPLVSLPACPCQYPSGIFYDDKIWDDGQRKYFRWRDVNSESERIDVYKPGATYCVRSLLSQGSGHAAAQHCCYDRQRRLLTRGSGAGTPNFVSPELSAELHAKIDILPWRLCRGDFSRFNRVRPPNNDNRCKTNPDEAEYRFQINSTKYY